VSGVALPSLRLDDLPVIALKQPLRTLYERRDRPEEKVYQPWIDHNDQQVLGGFRFLDQLAEAAGDENWLAGGSRQADITSAVGYAFAKKVRPDLDLASEVPHLAAFAQRCERLDIFERAPLP
jgi:glutathione S-transferase